MDEKKFVGFKKEELGVKEYVKRALGKGKISNISIEYIPVGEKIVVATSKPGLVIGRRGEKIEELTRVIKKRFHFDNPHVEIKEITEPFFDAHLVADEIAMGLEREGSLKFKVIAYKMLQEIMRRGALGVEIVLSGKLPSERARSWRFAQGYLKKTGNPAKVVDRAISQAKTLPGIIGIKVSILPPKAHIHDRIVIDDALRKKVSFLEEAPKEVIQEEKKPKKIRKKKEQEAENGVD
ncbi:MAG: 30S ribosomal protein S3 [Nanoarchaeota archaeon]